MTHVEVALLDFYQHFQDLISEDSLSLLHDFYNVRLDMARLNYGMISFLPKCPDADRIQTCCPNELKYPT